MQGRNDEYRVLSSALKVKELREIIFRQEKKVGNIQVVENGSKQLTRNGRAFTRLLYSTSRFGKREIAEAVDSNPSAIKRVVENRYGKSPDDLSIDEDIFAKYITHTMNLQKFANELPPPCMKKSRRISTIPPTLPPSKQEAQSRRDRDKVEEVRNVGESAKPQTENLKTTYPIKASEIHEEQASDTSSEESNIFKTKTVAHSSEKDADSDSSSSEDETISKNPVPRSKVTYVKEKRARFSVDLREETRSAVGKLLPSPVSANRTPSNSQKRKCDEMEGAPIYSPSSSKIPKQSDTDDDHRRITRFFKSRGYYLSAVIDDLVEAGLGPKELELLRGKEREAVVKQLVKWGDLRRIKADALAQAIESATSEDWRKLVG